MDEDFLEYLFVTGELDKVLEEEKQQADNETEDEE